MNSSSAVADSSVKTTGVLIALSLAMFVYVIDTTIMGVSISDLVVDLNTDIGNVQMAITIYTLTMAAFMVTGGKLGAIWGARKAFQIGLVIYGIGTVITAISPNIVTLLIGWSVLEGLGSALLVPAISTLVRSNFPASRRAAAFGTLGGVAAAGAAVGPIVGGWVTTNYTWRIAFIAEAVIVVGVLIASRKIKEGELPAVKPTLDVKGIILSVLGLAMLVFGILQTSALGWGSPVVWFLVFGGIVLLGVFSALALKLEKEGGEPLVRLSIAKKPSMFAGLPVTVAQTFAQNGVMFLMPLYCQLVLGLNALDTGLALLPLSVGVMGFSIGTSKLGHRFYPRTIVQVGLLVLFAGGVLFALAIPGSTGGGDFALAMFAMGAGIGTIAAQLPNLMLAGVSGDETSEAAGLKGTAENLGMSLGTAVAGSVVLLILGLSFSSNVDDSTVLADADKAGIERLLEDNADTVGTGFEELVADRPPEIATEITRIAAESADQSFQFAVLILGLIALIGYLGAFKLPKVKLEGDAVDEAVRATNVIARMQLEPTGGQR